MNFYENLLNLYSRIDFRLYKESAKLDSSHIFYLADSTKQFITVSRSANNFLFEIDIKSAFPTICKCLFGEKSDFVKGIYSLSDKKERNIFISTNLKNTKYLKLLNIICKIIILGTTFESYSDLSLLELKKDGVLISCKDIDSNIKSKFIDFVINNGFEFHRKEYQKYIRCNRTTMLTDKNQLIIKGMYKHFPLKVKENIMDILSGNDNCLDYYQKIYSEKYFRIVKHNNLNEIINGYYLCENGRFLDQRGKYVKYSSKIDINPRLYLKTFIFPVVLSTKIEN